MSFGNLCKKMGLTLWNSLTAMGPNARHVAVNEFYRRGLTKDHDGRSTNQSVPRRMGWTLWDSLSAMGLTQDHDSSSRSQSVLTSESVI